MTRLDEALRFHETALRLRSQRQAVLASNIANADTPHYKARDMDFSRAMKMAMSGSGMSNSQTIVQERVQGVTQHRDGNTVNVDQERAEFTDNALRYEAGVRMVNSQIKGLLSVLQG